MRFANRLKSLRVLKKISREIKNNKIDKSKIEKSSELLKILQNGNITDDYIKDIDVILYLAQKTQPVNSGNWVNLSSKELTYQSTYNKLNDLVDELAANNFIHQKIAGIGGLLSFVITHKDNMNYFIHHKLNEKLDRLKFLKSTGTINKFLNSIIERSDQIIIGILLIILGLLIEKYLFPLLV